MKIFFSVGEPSGDIHGANLIRALQKIDPTVEAVGYGGPEMASAGCRLHADLTALAVMWIARVLVNLHKFLGLLSRADRYFRHHRPDAVVLIDYPGFNWWIARRAKAHGIPVFYYVPPQIWAWGSWRIRKMRRYVDHVLCALPFETHWFQERGCNAVFVGHPFFDEVRRHELDADFVASYYDPRHPLVAILPGSRTQEVSQNLKYFLEASRLVSIQVPSARFAVACYKPAHADMAREMIREEGLSMDVFVRKTPELIRLAECCISVSGSVSIELLYHTKPTVIFYRLNRAADRIHKWFVKVKYITLVNLLVSREPFAGRSSSTVGVDTEAEEILFPEYLTSHDKSLEIALHVVGWLSDSALRQKLIDRLKKLKDEVAHGGSSAKAAAYIASAVRPQPNKIPRPHFLPSAKPPEPQIKNSAA